MDWISKGPQIGIRNKPHDKRQQKPECFLILILQTCCCRAIRLYLITIVLRSQQFGLLCNDVIKGGWGSPCVSTILLNMHVSLWPCPGGWAEGSRVQAKGDMFVCNVKLSCVCFQMYEYNLTEQMALWLISLVVCLFVLSQLMFACVLNVFSHVWFWFNIQQ